VDIEFVTIGDVKEIERSHPRASKPAMVRTAVKHGDGSAACH